MQIFLMTTIIFFFAILMTMAGRGGGNYYVLTLALFSVPMHEAATTGQLILFVCAISATFIFGKKHTIEWKLFLFIGAQTTIFAFLGGYFSNYFSGQTLKYVFSFFLLIASLLMFKPIGKSGKNKNSTSWYYWCFKTKIQLYEINLIITIPLICATGFFAGMVGVSGGSFLIPLMVLICRTPMKNAVGTSIALVSATAFTGFIGHTISGHFNYEIALPVVIGAAIGGIIGSSFVIKTKPKILKQLFAITNLGAAIIMYINAYIN